MTCRDEILAVVQVLKGARPDGTFGVEDVLRAMHERGTVYADRTIRAHVISKMCTNAPAHHGTQYPDFERVARNTYRLIELRKDVAS